MGKRIDAGGAGESKGIGAHEALQKGKERGKKAEEVAEKTEDLVENSDNFLALCTQFARQKAQEAGEIHKPPATKKSAKTKPAKEAAAPSSPPAAKASPRKKEVSFVVGTDFTEAKPLTRKRVSTKPPETKGCLARLKEVFSSALRALLSCFSSFRSPHST